MNDKLTLQELIDLLAARHQMEPQDADAFVREFWALIEEGLKSDNYVKIKGLGTFKLIDTEARESINVQTGERIEIQSHARVTFSPEASLRDLINRPFAHFETVVLNESTNFDDLEEVDRNEDGERSEDADEVDEQEEQETSVAVEIEASDAVETVASDAVETEVPETAVVTSLDESVELTEKLSEEPVGDAIEESVGNITEEPIEDSTEEPVEESPAETVVESSKESVEASSEEPVVEAKAPTESPKTNPINKTNQELIEIALAAQKQNMENDSFCRKSKRRLSWCVVACSLLVGVVIGGFTMLYFLFGNAEISENIVNSLSHSELASDTDSNVLSNIQTIEQKGNKEIISSDTLAVPADSVSELGEHEALHSSVKEKETASVIQKETAAVGSKEAAAVGSKETATVESEKTASVVQKNSASREKKKVSKQATEKQVTVERQEMQKKQQPVYLSEKVQYKITGTIATHTLRNGETLTRVALKFYGNKKIWPYLVMHNKGVITNPDNVPIGTTIKVPKLVPVSPGS